MGQLIDRRLKTQLSFHYSLARPLLYPFPMPRPRPFDLDALRALLRHAAFIGLPSASLALAACDCPPPSDHLFLVREPDAQVQALIEKCVDGTQRDCLALCDLLIVQEFGFSQDSYFAHCEVHPQKEGYVVVHAGWESSCPGGRRPEGFQIGQPATHHEGGVPRTTGNWLACLAQLETASIPAFARVQHELSLQDAPASFIRNAQQAIADETKHEQMIGTLAKRHGAFTIKPMVPRPVERPLVQMLRENAVEGCVREMFGALLAHHQGATATDPAIRNTMRLIAEEETQHAALAWNIHGWGVPKLTPGEQRHIDEDARQAVQTLRLELEEEFPVDMRATLGLPSAQRAIDILDGISERMLG